VHREKPIRTMGDQKDGEGRKGVIVAAILTDLTYVEANTRSRRSGVESFYTKWTVWQSSPRNARRVRQETTGLVL
jgi:hypothetical protein